MQTNGLHGVNGHHFLLRRVISLEHGIQQTFQKGDLVGRMNGRELGDRIGSGVDQSEYSGAVMLRQCATDGKVKGRYGVIGRGDI